MKKRVKLFFGISVISYALSSVALCLIPFVDTINLEGANKVFAYFVGILFWLGLAVGQITFWMSNLIRIKSSTEKEKVSVRKFGIISFFKNTEAKIADILLAIAVIWVAVLLIFDVAAVWPVVLSLALLFMSFNLHCMLNGVNYSYIKGN